jgi:hypothetical protein
VPRSNLRPSDFRDLSNAMLALANEAPERTTLPQMTFFLLAAMADLKGKPSTFTEIRDGVGPTVNRSLHTTYKIFLDRPLRRSDYESKRQGLGWLTRELDPEDNRRNYLRLTASGKRVLLKVLEA